MRSLMTLAGGATLMLAACGPSPQAATNTTAAAPKDHGYVARVTALPQGQLRGVLFRAIADAGRGCQAIEAFSREPDRGGKPVWSARCTDGSIWLVALGDDGVAQVTGLPATRS